MAIEFIAVTVCFQVSNGKYMKKSGRNSEKTTKKTKTWSFHRASSVPVFHVDSSFAFYDYHALLVAFLPIAFYLSFACFLKISLKVKEEVQEFY